MGPLTLILLTSMLLSSYFHPGRVVDAQSIFTIKDVTLSIEPSTDVQRGTNVTVRCHAAVSSSGQEALNRQYTILKDREAVYTKSTTSSEDLLYQLPMARVSNNGKYKCQIIIGDKKEVSGFQKLTVTGLSKPSLHLDKAVVSEGEEATARCTAPGETGSIIFYFYENSKEIRDMQANVDYAETKIRFTNTGYPKFHCSYTVVVVPESFPSEQSDKVTVSVKEFPIKPVLDIFPLYDIFEGDTLSISCYLSGYSSQSTKLFLSQGTRLLSNSADKLNHSMVALANDSGEFECRLETGNVVKAVTEKVSVTELFSVPTFTMSPAEVFQREPLALICRSESLVPERLNKQDIIYTLEPADAHLSNKGPGVFHGRALSNDFNYTCTARAKGITKQSKILTVRPKVPVSIPKIMVRDRVILGQPFEILCRSDSGSLPINYTLLYNYESVEMITVKRSFEEARFTITISRAEELSKFLCEANNDHKKAEGQLSGNKINATVIVPLSNPSLIVPSLEEISEGDDVYLICGVQGTPPVTFKWYRVGEPKPLYTTTSHSNNTSYLYQDLTKRHSGMYFCEASNSAQNVVRSEQVTIEVRMALWKKALIGGVVLLVLAVLLVLFVVYYRSKRVKVDRAVTSVWSERPPDAAIDEETSMMSNEPDVEYTEVVHPRAADSTKVPLKKGTDTVYSELQNSPQGDADQHDYGSVEYADLNGEQPEINHSYPEVNNYQDLPVPVD